MSKKALSTDITINSYYFGQLAIAAIRYALWKRNNLPEDIVNAVGPQANKLSYDALLTILDDIDNKYLKGIFNQPHVVCDDFNVSAWRWLRRIVYKAIKERVNSGVEVEP